MPFSVSDSALPHREGGGRWGEGGGAQRGARAQAERGERRRRVDARRPTRRAWRGARPASVAPPALSAVTPAGGPDGPRGGAVGARAGLRARAATPASGEAAAEAETKARDGGAGRAQQRSRVCERARACGGTGPRRAMALVTAHSPPPGARKPFMKSISYMWGGEDERRERESKVSHERPRRF